MDGFSALRSSESSFKAVVGFSSAPLFATRGHMPIPVPSFLFLRALVTYPPGSYSSLVGTRRTSGFS